MVEEIEKRIGGLTSLVGQEGWDPANREGLMLRKMEISSVEAVRTQRI